MRKTTVFIIVIILAVSSITAAERSMYSDWLSELDSIFLGIVGEAFNWGGYKARVEEKLKQMPPADANDDQVWMGMYQKYFNGDLGWTPWHNESKKEYILMVLKKARPSSGNNQNIMEFLADPEGVTEKILEYEKYTEDFIEFFETFVQALKHESQYGSSWTKEQYRELQKIMEKYD